LPPPDAAEIEQLRQQLTAMETRVDQLAQTTDVEDLSARVAALEQQLAMPEAAGAKDLAARVEALEAHLEAAEEGASQETHAVEAGEQGQAFQVATTVYLLDMAGLHAMEESINQENTIDPGIPGTVERIRGLMVLTAWPEELQDDAIALEDTLASFAAALAEDDVEAAKPLATQVHEQQHDLSHAVGGWLSEHGFAVSEEAHDESK
jgi:hypothetical protein